METKKELEARKKILRNQIASILKVDVTKGTAQERLASMQKAEPLRLQLLEIEKKLKGTFKPDPVTAKVDPNIIKIPSNAPAGITQNVARDILAAGLDISNEAIFAAGGVGNTAFVWESDSEVPSMVLKSGSKTVPNIKLASTVVTNFWNDSELQNKIIGSYAAKGRTIGQLEAYNIWETLVKTAASIYQGGRGAKVTPMQLLNDTLKSVRGDEAALPQRTVNQLDRDTTFKQIDNWSSDILMRKLNDNEKESLFTLLKDLNTGTVTTTKKVRNKKGVLENVSVTTPGLTDAAAQKTIEDKLKELNPDEVDRTKRIEFSSWLSQNMAGA
jgi:hypothetical protein